MPKRIDFTLTEADLQVIAQAVKSDKRPEVRQRAMGLRLLHEGQSPQEVARLMDVSQPTVYSWHHRWCENRLEGLAKRPKSGRPRKADATYVALLEAVIEQDPQALGYDFTVWTANRLRLHLEKETGVLLGATQFHGLLKENEFVYRRPKHDLTDLQDATAREAATEWLDELKKSRSRSDRPFLCGRKQPSLVASVGRLLDEKGLPKAHSDTRLSTMAAYLWRVQLGHR